MGVVPCANAAVLHTGGKNLGTLYATIIRYEVKKTDLRREGTSREGTWAARAEAVVRLEPQVRAALTPDTHKYPWTVRGC